jgi:molecular chaperone DnaK
VFTKLIERNTTIPTKKSQVFSTADDNQGAVTVRVLQGEREMAADNKSLGKLELTGLPPATRGVPEIEVSFELDANGLLHVHAKDAGTGKAQSMRVYSSTGLDESEVERLIVESERYRAEDRRRREVAEARNQLDGLIYSTSRSLDEFGDRLPESDARNIRRALRDAEAAIKADDAAMIHRVHDMLFAPRRCLRPSTRGCTTRSSANRVPRPNAAARPGARPSR